MQRRVIFFDIGHTLVTGAEASPRRLLAARLQLGEKDTRRVGRIIMTHPAREPEHLVEALKAALPGEDADQLRSAVECVWREQIECVKEIPGATSLLRTLKAEGLRLGIISNIWHPFYQGFCRTCSEIVDLLDYTVLSYRTGEKKPSLELYRHAVEMTGEGAPACWMVGDTYELDVAPARAVGMRTIWVLSRPEKERSLLVQTLRGDKARPDWVVESLDEVLPFLQDGKDRPC